MTRKFDDEEEGRQSTEPARYIAHDRGGRSYCALRSGTGKIFRVSHETNLSLYLFEIVSYFSIYFSISGGI